MYEDQLRGEVCEIGRRLYARSLVSGSEGNISVRMDQGRFLCTPTMVSKGYMQPEDLAIVDAEGNQTDGYRKRSSEILVHLAVYQSRPDVQAVIHAHPPYATSFAVTRRKLPTGIHPEQALLLGTVPIVKYAMTGTQLLADEVAREVEGTVAVLLANHGAVTFGPTLESAWQRMEVLEGYCRLLTISRQLGKPRKLARRDLRDLEELKSRMA
jgi:L-fuculose-phosphate aldolase